MDGGNALARTAFVVWLFMVAGVSHARADCSEPIAPEGRMVYNSSYKVAQFCDGTNWISMAGGSTADARIGQLAAGKWCGSDGNRIDCTLDAPLTLTGSDMQVVFNDGGAALAGAAQLIWDKVNDRLGIGTSSPLAPLHVEGTALVNTKSGTNPFYITRTSLPAQDGFLTNQALMIGVTDTELHFHYLNDEQLAAIHFRIQNTDTETGGGTRANDNVVMTLTSEHVNGGRVGIGTTAPQARLDVQGTLRLAKNTSAPASCTAQNDGTIALTGQYTLCACKGAAASWVRMSDGVSACAW